MNTVTLTAVRKEYPLGSVKIAALKNIDLTVGEGEFLTVAGPSGSGKSTLLNLIGCLDAPTGGKINIAGTDTSGRSETELNALRSRFIGFIFQSFNLIPVLNVFENIELPLLLHRDVKPAERRERVFRFMRAVGLERQHAQRSGELSGGQRQRVAVARALVTMPRIVLADEPTANLDSKTGLEIIDLMHGINRNEGCTFIFSSHDPRVIGRADRIVHLEDGEIRHEERK